MSSFDKFFFFLLTSLFISRCWCSLQCNLVEACRIAGVYVPTLCYHPRLQPLGKCGLCNVQVEGAKEPVLGCSSFVVPGMRIRTATAECITRTQTAMSRIVNKVRSRQPEAFSHAPELARLVTYSQQTAFDDSSHAIQLDLNKCVECARCVRVCRDVQGLGIWKVMNIPCFFSVAQPAFFDFTPLTKLVLPPNKITNTAH